MSTTVDNSFDAFLEEIFACRKRKREEAEAAAARKRAEEEETAERKRKDAEERFGKCIEEVERLMGKSALAKSFAEAAKSAPTSTSNVLDFDF